MSFSRTDTSRAAEWWFTIDRTLVGVILVLMAVGIVISLAASPAVALRKGLPTFHFAERHVLFAIVGSVLMLAVSMLSPGEVRRLALGLLLASLALMIWVALTGLEVNGAKRWVRLGGHSFQPSEMAKPAFVVMTAWLLAKARRENEQPPLAPPLVVALALFAALVGLLVIQPDIGQTLLVSLVWGAMFVLSGQPLKWAAGLGLVGVAGFAAACAAFDHVRSRVKRFIDPSSGDTFQTDRAIQSFTEGGFLGRGPGEGTIKSVLPDAHTDFIFAVIGEEYGVLACLALLGLFAVVAGRALLFAASEPDPFLRLAVTGLALLFALQAAINMGVNVGLLPAKGMTLPFISAGGSSNLAISLTMGMLLALMRRRPDASRVKKPQLQPTLGRNPSREELAIRGK
ncbi:MAG: putative lipid II flippase FtsW [Hyphomicrobiaceae bacterium]